MLFLKEQKITVVKKNEKSYFRSIIFCLHIKCGFLCSIYYNLELFVTSLKKNKA